jgi:hypothetical protein
MTSDSPRPESEYSEALATFRHYSNLRFAELTLFAAINGGLGTLVYEYLVPDLPPGLPRGHLPGYVISAGKTMSLIFLGLEISLSAYLLRLRSYIVSHWPGCHLATTPKWALWLPVVLFPLAYVLVWRFWNGRHPLPGS